MNGHGRVLKFIDFDIRKEFEGQTEQNDNVEDKGNAVDQADEQEKENNDVNEEEEKNDGTENE